MKNTIKTKIIFLTLALLLIFSSFCMAANTVDNKAAKEPKAQTEETKQPEATYQFITSDVYKFENDVVINDIIDGNVFAYGNTVSISGEIGGDVFILGNNVKFTDNAYVHGNIFVMADNLSFGGIAYDIYGYVRNVTLEEKSIIARDIKIIADNLTINGAVKRNAFITTNNLKFAENTKDLITGNLEYTANSELTFNKEAVKGEVKFTPASQNHMTLAARIANVVNSAISAVLYSVVIVLLAIWLAPKFTNKVGTIIKDKPIKALGLGILTSIVVIAFSVAIILLTYGLGVGISFAVITLFILLLTIAKTVFGMAIAKLITNKFNMDKTYMHILFTLLVVLVVTLLGFIPYVGSIILFIVTMYGIGIISFNVINKKEEITEVKE